MQEKCILTRNLLRIGKRLYYFCDCNTIESKKVLLQALICPQRQMGRTMVNTSAYICNILEGSYTNGHHSQKSSTFSCLSA